MTVTPPTPSSDLVPVYLKVNSFDGTPVNSRVTFTPNFSLLEDVTDDLLVIGKPLVGIITNGVMNYQLPATDDPDFDNGDPPWTYHVVEAFPGGRTYELTVPIAMKDTGINLRTTSYATKVTATMGQAIFGRLDKLDDAIETLMQYGSFNPDGGNAIVIAGSE